MSVQAAQYHNISGLADLKRLASQDEADAIAPVAKQFESLFLQMMLKSMRDTVPEGGMFSGGDVGFYQDMMDSQLSVTLSEGGGVGLAKIIERQLGGNLHESADPKLNNESMAASAASLSLQLRMNNIGGSDNDA